jgi:hypothetical protein
MDASLSIATTLFADCSKDRRGVAKPTKPTPRNRLTRTIKRDAPHQRSGRRRNAVVKSYFNNGTARAIVDHT